MKIRWKRLFKQLFFGKQIRVTSSKGLKFEAVLISGDSINLFENMDVDSKPLITIEIL